jgi:glycosyltransferase involved in cell wall biosynthesis
VSGAELVSVVINNYNYGRFLEEAIDSALDQGYPEVEVIVVDDGSTDNSRDIIEGYRDQIIPVLKDNKGQTSTFNAGFRVCRGGLVLFLDSDDALLPTAVERAVGQCHEEDVVKVHWPLWVVDANGRKTGKRKPSHAVPEGDLRETVVRDGPDNPTWPPTSGNAWKREFLEEVFPIPEMEKECEVGSASADAYLSMLAPLFGRINRILEPQGFYRIHGENDHSAMSFDKKLRRDLRLFDHRSAVLQKYCRVFGIEVDPESWEQNSWFHRLRLAIQEITALIPPEDDFILVDDGNWGMELHAGRRPIRFLERDGQYWGAPPDDETAVRELERLRHAGAVFIVFAWPAFWWLDYYSELHDHLRSQFRCALENDRLVVFDLRL